MTITLPIVGDHFVIDKILVLNFGIEHDHPEFEFHVHNDKNETQIVKVEVTLERASQLQGLEDWLVESFFRQWVRERLSSDFLGISFLE